MGFSTSSGLQQSSDVDHDKTTNRSHSGDTISPDTIDANDGTVGDDPILAMPDTLGSTGLSIGGGWTTINANQPTFVVLYLKVETDGTTSGQVSADIDMSGGTSADLTLPARQNSAHSSGTRHHSIISFPIPPGATVRLRNDDDPAGSNTLQADAVWTMSS